MREVTLIKALEMHDQHINVLRRELRDLRQIVDRTYMQSLTHVMMWDVLMTLLADKGVVTKEQFDLALKDLSDRTKAAMEADAAKNGPQPTPDATPEPVAETKVTVLSDKPAIAVV